MKIGDPDKEVFRILLDMVKGSRGDPYRIGNYTLHFRYAVAKVGEILPNLQQVFDLVKFVPEEDVKGLVFDVIGFYREFTTEFNLRDNTIYVFPDRSVETVNEFIETIRRHGAKSKIDK